MGIVFIYLQMAHGQLQTANKSWNPFVTRILNHGPPMDGLIHGLAMGGPVRYTRMFYFFAFSLSFRFIQSQLNSAVSLMCPCLFNNVVQSSLHRY